MLLLKKWIESWKIWCGKSFNSNYKKHRTIGRKPSEGDKKHLLVTIYNRIKVESPITKYKVTDYVRISKVRVIRKVCFQIQQLINYKLKIKNKL